MRDQVALDTALEQGVGELGRLDVVVANAGISSWGRFWELPDEVWLTTIDINLTGAWRTFRAATPRLIEQGDGGSLIAISSVAGIKALPGQAHYTAAKHGLVGLVNAAAIELGPYGIRVNSVHPWGVDTPMAHDPAVDAMLEAHPTYRELRLDPPRPCPGVPRGHLRRRRVARLRRVRRAGDRHPASGRHGRDHRLTSARCDLPGSAPPAAHAGQLLTHEPLSRPRVVLEDVRLGQRGGRPAVHDPSPGAGRRRSSASASARLTNWSTSSSAAPSATSCSQEREDLVDDDRRKPQRRLVDEHQLGSRM